MLSNDDPTASTGAPEPTTPVAPVDLDIVNMTPTIHRRTTTLAPCTSNHLERDETLIALGQEIVGYVVGPMPADKFLDLLPSTRLRLPTVDTTPSSLKRKLPDKGLLKDLAKSNNENNMYDLFVRIPFSFLFSWIALSIF